MPVRILTAAEEIEAGLYSADQWLTSNFIVNWFKLNASYVEAAANARIAAAVAELKAASLGAAVADLAITAGIPIAAWIGVFAALGAPYAQARTIVKERNFKSGFSQGFVCGALSWKWSHTRWLLAKYSPDQINGFDESLGYIGANAFNDGLKAGFTTANLLDETGKKNILKRLRHFSPSTHAHAWDRVDQWSYVIELASAGLRYGVFKEP